MSKACSLLRKYCLKAQNPSTIHSSRLRLTLASHSLLYHVLPQSISMGSDCSVVSLDFPSFRKNSQVILLPTRLSVSHRSSSTRLDSPHYQDECSMATGSAHVRSTTRSGCLVFPSFHNHLTIKRRRQQLGERRRDASQSSRWIHQEDSR